ncbi:MAG: hypothetical protein K9N46_11260 [Candidatus Marinimicrobia bacterium]|nr:hypothetical protein [Candidatus Neomarinimicrobiota bacterium]MCF7827639.1 hypothetical protein [Candidatus Neomarinimicrobiota bacterium]MCF7881306.1 hypothetical protein [Candidatus Neomarinimicrobiota bacterium]
MTGDKLRLMWRTEFSPGSLRAVGLTNDGTEITATVATAGAPSRITLEADRQTISADGKDLSFVTARIIDDAGVLVPHADNLVNFTVTGPGSIKAVGSGSQTSHEPFTTDDRKAFNGLCLAIIQSEEEAGDITLTASADGLQPAVVTIKSE